MDGQKKETTGNGNRQAVVIVFQNIEPFGIKRHRIPAIMENGFKSFGSTRKVENGDFGGTRFYISEKQ